ncbi:MAG: hypothetical protein NT154_31015 [Verrucomicrobia bacterium]|nr:hypothetical protein [Verrucomicrobiota bacterium]
MSIRYLINIACAVLSILLGLWTVYLGLWAGKDDLVAGGVFLTVVMCSWTLYVFGVRDQTKERNRQRYLAWRHGSTRGARVSQVLIVLLMICTALHALLQFVKLRGFFG